MSPFHGLLRINALFSRRIRIRRGDELAVEYDTRSLISISCYYPGSSEKMIVPPGVFKRMWASGSPLFVYRAQRGEIRDNSFV